MNLFLNNLQTERRNIVRASAINDFHLTDESKLIGYIYEESGRYQMYYLEPGIQNLVSFICSNDKDKLVSEAFSDDAVLNTLGKYLDLTRLDRDDLKDLVDQLVTIQRSGQNHSFRTVDKW